MAGAPLPTGGSSPSVHHVGIVSALLVFVASTLIVVVGVIVTDAVDRWWILVPVMLVVFVVAFGVFTVISWMLADMGE
jgi:hypothetical protein